MGIKYFVKEPAVLFIGLLIPEKNQVNAFVAEPLMSDIYTRCHSNPEISVMKPLKNLLK